MRYKQLILIIILIIFTACGGGNGANTIYENKNALDKNSSFKHASKTVTIYVHGFKPDGYYRDTIYGDIYDSNFTTQLRKFTNLPSLLTYDRDNFSNIITGVEYYGNQSPTYYTQTDIDDINSSTNGIPKYALVVAKFTKHILEQTGATKANIVSVSMGSLITRYMIEKNLENLASDKKIEKWLTAEGVLRGNYALSKMDDIKINYIKNLADSFFQDSPESQQMKYKWIDTNLTKQRSAMSSPYYKDILVGQISLTDSEKKGNEGLQYILSTHGGFQPNDGYQLVKDTYFEKTDNAIQVPSHTLIHTDHTSINDSNSVYASISAFLEAKKRVRITLIDVTVDKLYEDIVKGINEQSEIVFANQIYSPKAMDKFNIKAPIAQRVYDSGTLPIYHFKKRHKQKETNQILFDDFVLNSETKLQIELEGYEIDRSTKYDIDELSVTSKESLGITKVYIDLVNGIYPIVSDDWSGHIQVEVVEM